MKKSLIRDISRISGEFIDSLNRFELLSIATKEGIWEYDCITEKAYYNNGMMDLFGYTLVEMDNNKSWWRNNIHPTDKVRIIDELDTLLESDGTVWWGQYNFLCKDGSYKKVLDRLFIIRGKDTKPLKLIGTMQDLSELDTLQHHVDLLKKEHHKAMVKAIIKSEESERKNISDELHENVNQVLAAVNMKISAGKAFVSSEGEDWLQEVHELLQYSINRISNIAKQLTPLTIKSLGLKTVISDLLQVLHIKKNIVGEVNVDEAAISRCDEDIQTLLFRIAQLQVANIGKHSGAQHVVVNILQRGHKICMRIQNDGAGIDVKNLKYGRGFSSIQERVEAFGGDFNIESDIDSGFLLEIII